MAASEASVFFHWFSRGIAEAQEVAGTEARPAALSGRPRHVDSLAGSVAPRSAAAMVAPGPGCRPLLLLLLLPPVVAVELLLEA